MDKLKFFTFNNLRWQYRKFPYSEICREISLSMHMPYDWLEPFARSYFDTTKDCTNNLFRMIGLLGKDMPSSFVDGNGKRHGVYSTAVTNNHFVDDEGVAWPEGSIVICTYIAEKDADDGVIILIAPRPRFS